MRVFMFLYGLVLIALGFTLTSKDWLNVLAVFSGCVLVYLSALEEGL